MAWMGRMVLIADFVGSEGADCTFFSFSFFFFFVFPELYFFLLGFHFPPFFPWFGQDSVWQIRTLKILHIEAAHNVSAPCVGDRVGKCGTVTEFRGALSAKWQKRKGEDQV